MKFSCLSITILTVAFVIFIIKAFRDDMKTIHELKSHQKLHTSNQDSKVKKMLVASRDQVFRGALLGLLEGSPYAALSGAVAWSLVGGCVMGVGDLFQWNVKLF